MSELTPEPLMLQPLSTSSDPETGRRRRIQRGSSVGSNTQKSKRRSTSSDRGGHYSSSSESHGGMADTETNEGHEKPAESSSNAPQEPVKKKRTRTLTTPHQSRVLHALLAQSRFPSTAQREEVGRAIGLSARKVQIWFQNQRQKARRPKNPNPGSSTTSVGPSTHLRSADSSLAVPKSAPHVGPDPSSTQSHPRASELPLDYTESRRYLSGPGVPGPILDVPPMEYRGSHEVGERRYSRTMNTSLRIHSYPSQGRHHSLSPTLPFQSHTPTPSYEYHMSRTLPPLIPSSSDLVGRGVSRQSSFESSDPFFAPSRPAQGTYKSHALPMEPHFIHTAASPTIRPFVVLSRPERAPSPQSPLHLAPILPLDSHQPPATSPRVVVRGITTDTTNSDRAGEEHPEKRSPVSQRSGRYDPVRGVVVPYPATLTTSPKPDRPGASDNP